MTSKLLICPYFGDLPEWFDLWAANVGRLREAGYTVLVETDEDVFRQRVELYLDIECPPMRGSGNIWDFRPALAVLYPDEVARFDFWGHTDFDCVYGRVGRFLPDPVLAQVDIIANHVDYISGPWTLYRNHPTVNRLFQLTGEWRDRMQSESPTGWAEKGYTEIVDAAHDRGLIRRRYALMQTRNWDSFDGLRLLDNGTLLEDNIEVMMAHFRRTKVYPKGCVP